MEHKFIEICLGENYGWHQQPVAEGIVYFKGYLNGFFDKKSASVFLAKVLDKSAKKNLHSLDKLDGHYAAIYIKSKYAIVIVDRVRSIPLIWSVAPDGRYIVGDHAKPVIQKLNLKLKNINADAAKDIAIAGYSLGRDTLYQNVNSMLPGDMIILPDFRKKPQKLRYSYYRPWLTEKEGDSEDDIREELRNLTLKILQKLIVRANGRQILLPLSAGLDSRLIASGLKHLGYDNVCCFSYGKKGNHEAVAAKSIAKKLGYPWYFLPTITKKMREFRKGEDFERYITLADSLSSTPVEQDVFTIMQLKKQSWANHNAIIVNGQSGDFISGMHIPTLLKDNVPLQRNKREQTIMNAMANKHFGLWLDLKDSKNLLRIKKRIWKELDEVKAPLNEPSKAYSLYEFLEFQNRQSKYVLGNQRSYEVFGWDWHLPLWDNEYVEFWQKVPLHLKYKQRLYRDMLVTENWGGVWGELLPAPHWIMPKWIRPFRHIARIFCAPFGKTIWHSVERRIFNHIMDNNRNYDAVSYIEVLTGPPHRNSISWLTKLYLKKYGLDRRGSALD